jgi:hypothetical protein
MKKFITNGVFVLGKWNLAQLMEIMQEYNIDCASQRMVIVKGGIGICLKGEVGHFSSLLPGTIQLYLGSICLWTLTMIQYLEMHASLNQVEHGPWRIDPYTCPVRGWMRKCKSKSYPCFCPCWLEIWFH